MEETILTTDFRLIGKMLQWLVSKADVFLTGLAATLGVGSGIALIALALRYIAIRLVGEKIKHYYEVVRLKLKEDYERERLDLAHKQKMIETMVVQLHDFAKNYYNAVQMAISGFHWELARGDFQMSFYQLAKYFAGKRKLRDALSGYFLKDITGERVVAHLDFKFRRECLYREGGGFLGIGDGDLLANLVLKADSPADFIKEVEGNTNAKAMYDAFKVWAQDKDKERSAIRIADVLWEVFNLEVNLSYEGWYPKISSHISRENLTLLKELSAELVSGENRLLTQAEWEEYIKKLERFAR